MLAKPQSMELETARLRLRPLTWSDLDDLKCILQDKETMRFYEGPMDDQECDQWLRRQLDRYENLGFGPLAITLKEGGEMIGQCGLSLQEGPAGEYLEVGYLLNRAFWHHGYAIESARAAKAMAFEEMDAPAVYSFIREGNIPSMNVAIRNGMTIRDSFVKNYRGLDMPHYIFGASNPLYGMEGEGA